MGKRELQKGDRVRVYGGIPGIGHYSRGFKAKVIGFNNLDAHVQFDKPLNENDSDGIWYVYPQQCRRLKPKAKPNFDGAMVHFTAGKSEPKRVERWTNIYPGVPVPPDGHLLYAEKHLAERNRLGGHKGAFTVKLTELRPGEVVVDREKLAKAWEEAKKTSGIPYPPHERSSLFAPLCRALGLPEAP